MKKQKVKQEKTKKLREIRTDSKYNIFVPSWFIVIDNIQESIYLSELTKKCRLAYANVTNIILKLQSKGFVYTEKKGRKRIITLTKDGKRLNELIVNMIGILRDKGCFK